MRDSVEMRSLFLRIARERVMNAVALGGYVIRDEDKEFLAFAGKWLQDNQC